ncbi:hypothetical protein PRZ48_004270 [Zasmidium cellare]|uniref:Uncharacterized protein n=1 Tax=Zasmidium cellare TaxID=395010 RepID=A0ABR0EQC8_ZASCE|nr:hypothetical protein PRZ48_004270 [Zasmidium cellare]
MASGGSPGPPALRLSRNDMKQSSEQQLQTSLREQDSAAYYNGLWRYLTGNLPVEDANALVDLTALSRADTETIRAKEGRPHPRAQATHASSATHSGQQTQSSVGDQAIEQKQRRARATRTLLRTNVNLAIEKEGSEQWPHSAPAVKLNPHLGMQALQQQRFGGYLQIPKTDKAAQQPTPAFNISSNAIDRTATKQSSGSSHEPVQRIRGAAKENPNPYHTMAPGLNTTKPLARPSGNNHERQQGPEIPTLTSRGNATASSNTQRPPNKPPARSIDDQQVFANPKGPNTAVTTNSSTANASHQRRQMNDDDSLPTTATNSTKAGPKQTGPSRGIEDDRPPQQAGKASGVMQRPPSHKIHPNGSTLAPKTTRNPGEHQGNLTISHPSSTQNEPGVDETGAEDLLSLPTTTSIPSIPYRTTRNVGKIMLDHSRK